MFTQINSIEDLDFLNKELLQKPFLGVDTEFRRTTKDNMRLALLQINDGEEIYLIDPLIIEEPSHQCDFLFSNSVIKVFHSCKEDIEAIYSWTGEIIQNLFDTQLAEAFLNGKHSIGYQALVEAQLDIIIEKNETRSNWLRRPLTDSQLNYAASDVEFLIHLFRKQKQALIETNKLSWHKEETDFLLSKTFEGEISFKESAISIPRKEEDTILYKLNEIIENIAEIEEINPTLLFSKRNQKVFLKTIFNYGFQEALSHMTEWRSNLLENQLKVLLKEY